MVFCRTLPFGMSIGERDWLSFNQQNFKRSCKEIKNMKVLVFGAGVLGSLYAAKLQEAGNDVTLVARGSRFEELGKYGVALKKFDTGEESTTWVRVVEGMPSVEYFDVCLVLVQKTQLISALSAIKVNPNIPTFVFMNNTAEGPQAMIDTVGRERVMMGHANAGGERVGHVVHYMITQEMTIGELDGRKSKRLFKLVDTLKNAGIKVAFSTNIDSWKRYHVAMAVPFGCAMYLNEACNIKLSENRSDVVKCLHGIREAFAVLRSLGYPVEPPKLKWVFAMPDYILSPLFQQVLKTRIADIGLARHLRNAREEMEQLEKEFFKLVEKSGLQTPVLEKLQQSSEISRPVVEVCSNEKKPGEYLPMGV